MPITSPLAVLKPRQADDTGCFHGEHCPHWMPPGPIRDALQAAALRAIATPIGWLIDRNNR